jgi:iron complex outermembrane receptor protein
MDMSRSRILFATSALAVIAGQAHAQTQPQAPAQVQVQAASPASAPKGRAEGQVSVAEVIVTATKQPLTLQAVPASISVVGAEALARDHIVKPEDLNGTIPALQIRPDNNDVSIFLRGVGHSPYSPQAENSVALNVDGVYMSRTAEGLGAFFDVSRVEVLNGPQGTLYGRNATGGVVNVISVMPTGANDSYVSLGGGNYGSINGEAVFSGPIGDKAQLRIGAYEHHREDGFGKDFTTGTPNNNLDEHGAKATLRLEPTDRLVVILRADGYFAKDHDTGFFYAGPSGRAATSSLPAGALLPTAPFDSYANVPGSRQVFLAGTSAEADYQLTPSIVLKSLTAYRHVKSDYVTDIDGTQLSESFLSLSQLDDHYSEELNATITYGKWFANVGFYYFGETNKSHILEPQPLYYSFTAKGLPIPSFIFHLPGATGNFEQFGVGRTDAEALYGNATYELTSRLKVGVGLRYSSEDKGNSGQQQAVVTPFTHFDGSRISSGLTPAFTASYKLTDDTNLYGTVSRGFKSGEWISGTSQYALPEYVWDYEGGVKGQYLDHKLQLSFGAFYYDYTNLQVEILSGAANSAILINVPKTTLYGLEGAGSLALPGQVDLHASVSALHTRMGNLLSSDPNLPGSPTVNIAGNQLPNAPKFQVAAGASKRFDFGRYGSGVLTAEYNWQDRTFLDIFNVTQNNYRPAYSMVNMSYSHSFPGAHWSVLLYGRNLTNTIVVNSDTVSSSYQQRLVNYSDPRTYGVTLKYAF